MLYRILIAILAILGAILTYAFLQPEDYRIERSLSINKPAEIIFPYLNNSKMINEWAPWPEIDPELIMSYSGFAEGVGAKSSWDSPGQMGAGSATVVESIPYQLVRTQLEYTRPFSMLQEAEMSISTDGTQSTVKWAVKGRNTFIQRVVCIFMDMDKMVGGNFESGLSKLKALVEKI